MTDNDVPTLLAACWTWAGDTGPGMPPADAGPGLLERISAAAATGWTGLGFSDTDLVAAKQTIGLDTLAAALQSARINTVEVEFLDGWWRSDAPTESETMLLEAAAALQATLIKGGVPERGEYQSIGAATVAERLAAVAARATAAGTRIGLEAMGRPEALRVTDVADLIALADHPGCGVVVDNFQLAAAGTPEEVIKELDWSRVASVELGDGRPGDDSVLVERCLPGEGTLGLTKFVRDVQAAGWDGYWGVEIISSELRRLPQADGVRVVRKGVLQAFENAATIH